VVSFMLRPLDHMAVLDAVTTETNCCRSLSRTDSCAVMHGHASCVWNRRRTRLCCQVVKTHLNLWTHGSKIVCAAGHLLNPECPDNSHSVSVIQSSQLTLFVLNTCTHCVGGMQVVRIVTAVLHTLEIALTKSGHGRSASGVSVRRQRVPLRGALTYSGRARVFWHIATCGRRNVSQPSAK
jgi:hypothetical protein